MRRWLAVLWVSGISRLTLLPGIATAA
jgi:hypothetical protein